MDFSFQDPFGSRRVLQLYKATFKEPLHTLRASNFKQKLKTYHNNEEFAPGPIS